MGALRCEGGTGKRGRRDQNIASVAALLDFLSESKRASVATAVWMLRQESNGVEFYKSPNMIFFRRCLEFFFYYFFSVLRMRYFWITLTQEGSIHTKKQTMQMLLIGPLKKLQIWNRGVPWLKKDIFFSFSSWEHSKFASLKVLFLINNEKNMLWLKFYYQIFY